MLVLSRRLHEKVVFPTLQASVQIVGVKSGVVRLGIEAPDSVPVFREEIVDRSEFRDPPVPDNQKMLDELTHLLNNRLSAGTIGVALLRRQLELGLTEEMGGTLDKIDQTLQTVKQRIEAFTGGGAPQKKMSASRRRALLVEDDRNECELLAGFLRLAGIDVQTAGDGADALDYLKQQGKPDVVLLDMMMPRCDGPTTVRAIRDNPAFEGLKIFGVTGGAVEKFGLDEGPRGIDRWFRKPINPEVLLRELLQNVAPVS
jgi:carbon storage regulator CsrA